MTVRAVLAINLADLTIVFVIVVLSFFALRTLKRSKRDGTCIGCPHQQACQRPGTCTDKEISERK